MRTESSEKTLQTGNLSASSNRAHTHFSWSLELKYYTMRILSFIVILPLTFGSMFGQTAKIQFQNFSLEIESLELWEQSKLLDITFLADSEVDIELGETLEGSTIKVLNSQLSNINIEMRYETSISIMNEGPHCDLIDWKHYTSDWSELSTEGTNFFKAASYSTQDWERFPEVTVDEILEAVKQECSGWEDHARTIKSPNDYPSAVGVSRYFLRISGTDKTGKQVTRTLTFNVPMGC